MEPEDEKNNAFKSLFGVMASKVMLQGDKNAPATFMRIMEDILGEYLHNFVWVYIDDILIYSDTPEEHMTHLRKVCEKLRTAQYYASRKKTTFFATQLEILGHIIDEKGIHAAPEKIRVLHEWHTPSTKKELQRFLGLLNYVAQFCHTMPHWQPHSPI